jgi:Ni,Fe-hydrogenase III large subunit
MVQRLNERLVGNRFLHGVCCVGGVRSDLDEGDLADLDRALVRVARDAQDLMTLIMGSETAVERFTGTGILRRQDAADLGAVGVAARASGVDLDSRRDHPHAFYDRLPMPVPVVVRESGDVKARVLNRMDEVIASLAIIRAVLANLPEGPIATSVRPLPANQVAFSVAESPRGETLHWVRSDGDGNVGRYRVRSASYPNWPAVAAAVPGNMVPDFPLINKSFELCYACLDR